MWAHIDDVREALEVQDEEAKMITAPNRAHTGPQVIEYLTPLRPRLRRATEPEPQGNQSRS